MKRIKGDQLEFIGLISRDGKNILPVTESVYEDHKDEYYTLNGLSTTHKTFVASGFNTFIVKLKEPGTGT